jgi:hypothetical protein
VRPTPRRGRHGRALEREIADEQGSLAVAGSDAKLVKDPVTNVELDEVTLDQLSVDLALGLVCAKASTAVPIGLERGVWLP